MTTYEKKLEKKIERLAARATECREEAAAIYRDGIKKRTELARARAFENTADYYDQEIKALFDLHADWARPITTTTTQQENTMTPEQRDRAAARAEELYQALSACRAALADIVMDCPENEEAEHAHAYARDLLAEIRTGKEYL